MSAVDGWALAVYQGARVRFESWSQAREPDHAPSSGAARDPVSMVHPRWPSVAAWSLSSLGFTVRLGCQARVGYRSYSRHLVSFEHYSNM